MNFQILDIVQQLWHDLQLNFKNGPAGQFLARIQIPEIGDIHLPAINFDYSPDRPLVALFTLLVVFVIGFLLPAHFNAHIPPLWKLLRKVFDRIVEKADNFSRTAGALFFRGGLILTLIIVFILLIYIIFWLSQGFFPAYRQLIEGFGLLLCIAGPQSARLLLARDPDFGFLQKATRVHLSKLDESGRIRLSIYWLSTQFARCVLLPVFGYLLLDLMGAFLCSALGWLVWRIGRDNPPYTIAAVPIFFERITGTIPHIILTLLLIFSSLIVSRVSVIRAIGGLAAGKRGASYGEGGMPLTIMAYANNTVLGGPMIGPSGAPRRTAWIGPKNASAQGNLNHLRQAAMMIFIAWLGLIGLLAAATML